MDRFLKMSFQEDYTPIPVQKQKPQTNEKSQVFAIHTIDGELISLLNTWLIFINQLTIATQWKKMSKEYEWSVQRTIQWLLRNMASLMMREKKR